MTADGSRELGFAPAGAWIFDQPSVIPARWGRGSEVLWAEGESLILAGPSGTGKTTITGQLVRAALGLQPEVLGLPVRPARRVLYLAMDRPRQIARALARTFQPGDREAVEAGMVVWPGPPPADLARDTDLLRQMTAAAGADLVVVDSLKDAAIGLTDDEVGAGWNRARQAVLRDGVDLLELHHTTKRGPNGAAPITLADLYGSAWITAGAGSVLLIAGTAGDAHVRLHHLKQPAEAVGPLDVIHDHAAGVSRVREGSDPLALLAASPDGMTANGLACAMFGTLEPDRNQVERARRRLDRLEADGVVLLLGTTVPARGGRAQKRYGATTGPTTRRDSRDGTTEPGHNHGPGVSAGSATTGATTRTTGPPTTLPPPSLEGAGRVSGGGYQ